MHSVARTRAIRHGGWQWVYAEQHRNQPRLLANSVTPSEQEVQCFKRQLGQIIQNHVKGSRPSLSIKVAEEIKCMAKACGLVCGKWMCFLKNQESIEKVWVQIQAAVRAGNLGPIAKLADAPARSRLICVYTYSFVDEEDVWRVFHTLCSMGVRPVSWKADMTTLLGVYTGAQVPRIEMGWFKVPQVRKNLKRARASI